MWDLFCKICGVTAIISLAVYLLPLVLLSFFARKQDLRKKYGDWAVVTGGSSGIGKALTKKFLEQGINVCVVALGDSLFESTLKELKDGFPHMQVRGVPVNLGKNPEEYMKVIRDATGDIRVSIFVSNAGYLKMTFFESLSIEQHMQNVECNSTAAIRLTHHFYSRMIEQQIKGCIMFTSSAVFYMPSPFACIYGGTKAMLTQFATSLAIEANTHGIDVTVFHPSYTHSNLYAGAPKLGVLAILSKFGWTPEDVADTMICSAGRVIVRDLGSYAICTYILSRLIDTGALSVSIIPFKDSMGPPKVEN